MDLPKTLTVDINITDSGYNLKLNGTNYPIIYPKEIWSKTSESLKKRLAPNLAMASTLYLPQILGLREIHYNTSRPIGESFFLRNGIYDAPYCANVDGKSSTQYLKDFFNTRYKFINDNIEVPTQVNFINNNKKKKALVLFSMGKESLLGFAFCKELDIEPILVTIIHPGFQTEWSHKKKLVEEFEKEFSTKIHQIDYQPGLLKEGHLFGLNTELGWGLHVTEYALLALPFAEVFNCDYIICGNEQSCNDTYYDTEDVLIYRAGLDQHNDWTKQQGLLQSLILGRNCQAYSLLEPLYEISETKILHSRYPQIAKYQMSCFSGSDDGEKSRWCQKCDKCAYMFALFRGFNCDMKKLGFTENLFDENHKHLYDNFFSRTDSSHFYGSQGELGLAFYHSLKYGNLDFSQNRFKSELLSKFNENFVEITKKYFGAHPTEQMPPESKEQLFGIFNSELKEFL
jgi:hypothetical protein